MATSWLYLVAIIDWFSRYVVAWEVDDTLEMEFVLRATDRALEAATPNIFNSDQGSHFTSEASIERLKNRQISISMDGKGWAFDNIFTERLWRTIKYEEVYLNEYESPREARHGSDRTSSSTITKDRINRWATKHQRASTGSTSQSQRGGPP